MNANYYNYEKNTIKTTEVDYFTLFGLTKEKKEIMNLKTAIELTTEFYKSSNNLKPSLCDVRICINDLLAEEPPESSVHRYDQERAWKQVRENLGNPVEE